jgi:RNA polymerase sigma-70 factor (ECF subfamily)
MIAGASRIDLNAVQLRASISAVEKRDRARKGAEASPADRLVELYEAHGGMVYARCRRMLREAAAAEDITQETFLRAHRHLASIPEGDAVLPWLYRIATNLCLNVLRDGRARPVLFEVPPERPAASLDDLLTNRDLVMRLVTRVSSKVQITAWLFYMDGMRQEEIAEVLGISQRAVAKRLAQFLRASRKFARLEGMLP